MSSIDVLRRDLLVARGLTPMTAAEMDALRLRCAAEAADGRFEIYKLSLAYDNPVARREHGFPDDPVQKEIKQLEDEVMNPGGTSR
jgi:hypothetical protein